VSERALELVTETLRAATADPELRDRVLRGRVEREQSAATLGTLGLASPAAPRRGRAPRKGGETATARRELKRLERQLADAAAREERQRGKVERATEALREEKERLAESKRATTELRRQVKAAERLARDQ
jgi:chromosome segregation ATPase